MLLARRRWVGFVFVATAVLAGCSDEEPGAARHEEGADDHAELALEGSEVSDSLDADGVSPPYKAEHPFVRLGVMWDVAADGELEVRTSKGGAEWTEWRAAEQVFAEAGARAGHVDAPEGSLYYQYRVSGRTMAPSWLLFEPLAEVGDAGGAEADDQDGLGSAEQEITASSIPIHSRASWGAKPPKCVEPMTPFRATVHHTAGPTNDSLTPQARLRQIQAFHMNTNGWCDIGYHYLVSRDGRVWTGRGASRMGGHVFNENTGNVGVSFIGNYMNVTANEAQVCGGAELFAWIHQKYPAVHLDKTDVKGHRQYGAEGGATACPGDKLFAQIGSILNKAKQGGCKAAPSGPTTEEEEVTLQSHILDGGGTSDIDGDGRADVCARNGAGIRCFRANGSGFSGSAIVGPELSNDKGWLDRDNYATLRMADIDGDGDADICARADGGLRCWKSKGTGFGGAIQTELMSNDNGWDAPRHYATIRFADVNGDGKADACGRSAAGFKCWASTGSGFATKAVLGPPWTDDNGWNDVSNYGTIRMADVDGDGKADVCARNNATFVCWLSDGAGFPKKIDGPDWSDSVWKDSDNWATIRMVDVDGDGRADVCGRGNLGFRCHLSTGTGFGPAIAGPELSNDNGWSDHDNYSTIRLADIDADGDADLCGRANSGFKCWKWTGAGFGKALETGKLANAEDLPRRYRTLRMADVDGDGMADMCARLDAGFRCWRSKGDGFAANAWVGPEWSDAKGWDREAHNTTIRLAGP